MGITYHDAMMYRVARRRGVSFKRTLTLGHLVLYLHRPEVESLRKQYLAEFGRSPTSLDSYHWGDFADGFLDEFLGVEELTVIDASAYQGADTVHDMNQPVPEAWRNRYDVIIDGGTLEHIFNVPIALSNIAHMLVIGGTVFISTPANNLMGHGFYQFSPELMFRVFSKENGFILQNVALWEAGFPSVELSTSRHLYTVADPQKVHKRVGLMSKRPAIMMVEATKINDVQMFSPPPIQSDYATTWTASSYSSPQKSFIYRASRKMLQFLPQRIARQVIGRYQMRQFSLRNELFYKRVHYLEPDSRKPPRG